MRHLKCLEKYHQRCLRRILKIRWQDRRTNNSVLEETNSTSIEAIIIRHQLRWAGHVVRMPDSRLPKKIMYSELRNGQRNQGGQFKRFKDVLKANLKKCLINTNDWENTAMDRPAWQQNIYRGSQHFEQQRRRQMDDKRNRRKERERLVEACLQQQRPADGGWMCHHCGRVCGSRIGLFSHQRTHRWYCQKTYNTR